MKSLNEGAFKCVEEMISKARELEISVVKMGNGATLIDAGVNSVGSYEAGRLFAEACMGGLGSITFDHDPELLIPSVIVKVSSPAIACLGSQYAGWALKSEGYFALGSGPARSLYRGEALYKKLGHDEASSVAVLALESSSFPPESLLDYVASRCSVDPQRLYVLVAPTHSLVGSIQVVSRVVETGIHKMFELGYDVLKVQHGFGVCPIPPLPNDPMIAMGRTNDAVLYGSRVWYTLRDEKSEIDAFIEKLPSDSSRDYGSPFLDLFRKYNFDFYQVDPLLFSPACVTINNVINGNYRSVGKKNIDLLKREWF